MEGGMTAALATRAQPVLVVTPHPLTLDGQRLYDHTATQFQPGMRLSELLALHGVRADDGSDWCVTLNGEEIATDKWGRIKLKRLVGQLVEARPRARDRDALRLVAFAVLMYYTMGAGAAAGGALGGASGAGTFYGLGGFAGFAAGAAAFYAGSSLINRYMPAKQQELPGVGSSAANTTYSISEARNNARPYEPMGLVLGEPYAVPDLAARPYTYFESGEQFLWQRFSFGLNCADVADLRNGDTLLSNYEGVSLKRKGFASGNTGLSSRGNVEVTEGAALTAESEPGEWVTRTSAVNTNRLSVDIEGQIFGLNSKGKYESRTVEIEMQYRAVGAGSWETFAKSPARLVTTGEVTVQNPDGTWTTQPANSVWVEPLYVEIKNGSTKPVRKTYSLTVDPGQYEVRMRKRTADESSPTAQNAVTWTALKSFQVDQGSYKGQALLEIQIQASGQLNGALSQINGVAKAKPMPYWNGAAWTTATTRANGLSNPGAIILLLLRGIYDEDGVLVAGMGLDDSMIDIESIKGFMVWCAFKGFTFDYFLQQLMSVGDLLDAVAEAGLGAISWHTGKVGVIWFAEDDPIQSTVNMAVTKRGSFSVEYDTQESADELEAQYFQRNVEDTIGNVWRSLRVLSPLVDEETEVPQLTARKQFIGVTTEAHAAILARFLLAQAIYQRKTVRFGIDLEHLTFKRGTVMALSHDLTQWGYGGRVRGAVNDGGTVTLTLDEPMPFNKASYVGLRLAGELQYRIFPCSAQAVDADGMSRTLTLNAPWPVEGGVPVPLPGQNSPAHDALWIADIKETPGLRVRVVGIEPVSNLGGANVTVVPEPDNFWNYVWNGNYTPPPNDSLLQGPPAVQQVTVTEQLDRQGNTYYTECTATFDASGSYDHCELWGGVADGDGVYELTRLGSTRSASISWRATGKGERWRLELRPFSAIAPGVVYRFNYTVQGLERAPSNIGEVTFEVEGSMLRMRWPAVADAALAGYEVRLSGAGWGGGGFYYRGTEPSCLVRPAAAGVPRTWYVCAFDSNPEANYSAVPAAGTFTVDEIVAPENLTAAFNTNTTAASVALDWDDMLLQFTLSHYIVSWGPGWSNSKTVKASTITVPANWAGEMDFRVQAVDILGNVGTGSFVTVVINPPSAPLAVRAEPLDNNVLLYWQPPNSGTLPIKRFEIRVGPVGVAWSAARDVGGVGLSTFTTWFSDVSAEYDFLFRAVDFADNFGAVARTACKIDQPPDFVLRSSIDVDVINGMTVEGMIDSGDALNPGLLGPTDPTRTWLKHYAEAPLGPWATPQEKIDAGFTVFAAPNELASVCTWEHDYEATIPATLIRATPQIVNVSGSVAVTVQIFYKLDAGDDWTAGPVGAQSVFATAFRYVKVVVTFAAAAAQNLCLFSGLNVRLSIKNRDDHGAGVSELGGAEIVFNYPFIDAETPHAQPQGVDSYDQPWRVAVVFTDTPNPTGAHVRVWDSAGVETAGVPFSWTVSGY
jgi:hypothetical protein